MASITGNGSKGHHKFTLTVNQQSQNIANNSSVVAFSFQISPIETSWAWSSWSDKIGYTVTINGVNYTGSIPNYDGYSTVTLYSGTQTINHNTDGTMAISFSFSVTDNAGQRYTPGNASASDSMPLSTIARASQPSCITYPNTTEYVGNIGGEFVVYMNRASDAFTHYVYCVWDNKNIPIASNVTDSCYFTIPLDFCDNIPTSMEGWGTIYVDTYSNGTYIGTKSVGFKATVPDYTPWGNITITGNNLLGGDTYVQYASTVSAYIEGFTAHGAYVTQYYSIVDNKEYYGNNFTSQGLMNGEKNVATAITDSRGKVGYISSDWFTVYPYYFPVIKNFNVDRDTNDPTIVYAYIEGNFAPLNNKNEKMVAVEINGVTKGLTFDGYNFSQTVVFENIPTDNTLSCKVAFQDSYNYIEKIATLPTVAVTLDFHHSGRGIAMGKVAEREDTLDVAWKIKNNSVPTLLGGLGTPIPSNSDLNTTPFLNPGNYVCPYNETATTLVNSPTVNAFKMSVCNCLGDWTDVGINDYLYIVREITDYNASRWVQAARREGGDWIYGNWRKILME